MEKFEEWSKEELDEFENLCAPLVKYLQTNKRCDLYSAIIVQWDGVLLATGISGGNVYFPFKTPD